MKKIIIVLILIASVQFIAISQDTYFKDKSIFRANPDWAGSVHNGNTLLVYGEGGVIMKSTDLGNTWFQSCINDSMYIIKMVARGNEFYGISRNQYIFKSTDEGNSWIVKDYGLQKQFNGLVQTEDKIYCLSENKIYEVNSTLDINEKYQFNSDTAYYEIAVLGDNIIFTAGKGKLGIINTKTDNQEIIDLEALGLCSDCRTLSKFLPTSDNLYFFIRTSMFKYNLSNNKITEIKGPMKLQDAALASFGNKLYNIFSIYDNYIYNIDSLYFYKYNEASDNWERVDDGKYERYIWNLKFTNLSFLDNKKIIAVGKNKLIYMSSDEGKTWTLKNSLTEYGQAISIFNEKDAIAASKFRFSKTTDGGLTWLPQRNHYSLYNKHSINYFNYYATPYIVDMNNVFALSPPRHTADTNIAISKDGLESFYFQNCYTGQVSTNFFAYYDFFSKIYIFMNATENASPTEKHLQNNFYAASLELKDTLDVTWHGGRNNADYISAIQYGDKVYVLIKDYSDSTNTRFALLSNGDSTGIIRPFYMVYEAFLDSLIDSTSYVPTKIFSIKNYLIIPVIDIMTGESSLFSYNLVNKQLTRLMPSNKFGNIILDCFELDHTSYIQYLNFTNKPVYGIFKNKDIVNDPTNWEEDSSRYVILSFLYNSDSLKVVSAIDRYFNSDKARILYLRPTENSSVIDKTEYKPNLYITDPIPNPAESATKFKVYYPINQDINNIQIKVSNVLGQIVACESSFQINSLNDHIVEIHWTIGNLQRGVYLINIKIGNEIGTKAIIIQ